MSLHLLLLGCLLVSGLAATQDGRELAVQAAAYTEVLEQDPANLPALLGLAQIYESVGADDRAIPLFQRVLVVAPHQIDARLSLAHLQSRDGLTVEAEDTLRKGLARHPQNLPLRLALAESQMAVSYAAGAEQTLLDGRQWHETDPRFRLMLGQVRLANRATASAIQDLEAAASLPLIIDGKIDQSGTNDVHAGASFTLALLAFRRGDNEALHAHLTACLQAKPQHRDALMMAAELAVAEERMSDAVTHLNHLLELEEGLRPTEQEVLRNLPFPNSVRVWAEVLAQNGHRAAALALLDRTAQGLRERGRAEMAAQIESWAEAL